MTRLRRVSWIYFCLLSIIAMLSIGELFGDKRTDEHWLAATFGPGMGVFGLAIAATAYRRGERWAWATFLVWPLFFAVHIAVFHTWIPDGVFLALAIVALTLTIPRTPIRA